VQLTYLPPVLAENLCRRASRGATVYRRNIGGLSAE
jgi:hypothetical protein